ncbi:hypothetical protein [Dyadobacter sandarakinus]|uniref:Uncharacterized protein n=1 Tax=Dyadobacter sandarakinus TaxID=2747268 RepID=A0ABX7I2V3_9BACT|nr:hypothetical protein [Dyadobacter sandarakinus]QRR00115.1 hypothetical protein HWI92_03920 [Dyadobacter sandarakinus]
MKAKSIRFFSPEENQAKQESTAKTKALPTGRISGSRKVLFPSATLEELGIESDNAWFQVGTDQGKRKIKNLYLVANDQQQGFQLVRTGRAYSLPLELILSKGGIDYQAQSYVFEASIFDHEGTPAYQLALAPESPQEKKPYTGKPRGRKPKNQQQEVDKQAGE